MSRGLRRRPGYWFGWGAAGALLLVVLAAGLFTRTEWGRGQVLAFTLRALGGQLNGELLVERLEGNLITGARIYQLAVVGADGTPLLAADSAYVDYEIPTLLAGDIVLNRVILYDAELLVRRLPGDTLWNYQQILTDTTPSPGPGRATLIQVLEMVDADITVRFPYEPEEELQGAARDSALAVLLADTTRMLLEPVPGGLLRSFLLDVQEGRLDEVVVAPEERGGNYLRVADLQGTGIVFRDTLRVRGLEGEVAIRGGVTRLRFPVLRLPESTGQLLGQVDVRGGEPHYDLFVQSDQLSLADLQWLYPRTPDQGRGQIRLWIESRPGGLMFLARDLVLTTPDTRLAGHFGMITGDTLRFLDADLAADPLDMQTVERLLPDSLPVRGLRIGAASIRSASP